MNSSKSSSGPIGPTPLAIIAIIAVALVSGFVWASRRSDDVATVDLLPVSNEEFQHRLELVAGPKVLQQIVNEDMDLGFAKKLGVYPSDVDVQKQLDSMKKQPDFGEQLKKSRETEKDLRREITVKLAQQAVITKGVTISDAEVKAYYDLNVSPDNPKARFHTPEAVQVAVIVTPVEDDSKTAFHQLARGAAFADVAKAYSRDPSANNGGLLPAIAKGKLDARKFPGLEQILFDMKVGDQIDPRKINGLWWIIRCVGRTHEQTVPFDKVRDECLLGAKLDKGLRTNGRTIQQELQDYKSTNPVQISRPEYKSLVGTGGPPQ